MGPRLLFICLRPHEDNPSHECTGSVTINLAPVSLQFPPSELCFYVPKHNFTSLSSTLCDVSFRVKIAAAWPAIFKLISSNRLEEISDVGKTPDVCYLPGVNGGLRHEGVLCFTRILCDREPAEMADSCDTRGAVIV